MKLNGIKHIFFDLDHTLWDFEKNSALTFKYIFSQNKIDVDFDTFMKVYSPINFDYWRLYRNEKVTKEELRYGRLKKTFDELLLPIEDQTINTLSSDYIEHLSDHNYLFEGALELLDYLKPKYNLHIITNGFEEVQHRKLENSKIKDYFSVVVTSELVGVKKPNPKIFNYALQKGGAEAKNSIMIGDSYEADIVGANNLGINTIFFDQLNVEVPNNQIKVNNLQDIITFL